MPHEFLLHADRCAGIVQPRPVGVTERMPAHIAQLAFPGELAPLRMNGDGFAIRSQAALPDCSTTLGVCNQTPASRTKIILLCRRSMKGATGDWAREDQLRATRTPLPLKQHSREIRIEREFILRILGLYVLDAAVNWLA